MYKLYCRAFQLAFRMVSPLLPWRRPIILADGAALVDVLKTAGVSRVLLVTDKGLTALHLPDGLLAALSAAGVACTVYDGVSPNPTIDNIEAALALYKQNGCQGLIAFGGGSPMDCAKGVGARVAHPNKPIQKMRGLLKVHKRLPLLIAVPTTAGTGSETTLAAVVVDGKTHEKYALNDHSLIPRYALLDAQLTVGLPPAVTAQTGLDALVHAVEAYIGRSNTKQTRAGALEATSLIFQNLRRAYTNGADIEARRGMQRAAFLAGAAFTRAYVGNIHAVAHTLGGMYNVPHGLANAVIMPYVLDSYGATIEKSMAALSLAAGVGDAGAAQKDNAAAMLAAIKQLNTDLHIPTKISELKEADIPLLASRAMKEANPLYPVPVIFDRAKMEHIFHQILATEGAAS
ncbi:MAG: iron-containing alcohol dehydrogenase [Oscillospiraceae bacterium]|nr:iron-containing alcohol dehydrogenase [Oscillospiraceae bacterium]